MPDPVTIDTIRAKYPQYNDLSDSQLADGLHQKFYADMPFDKFASKIGFSPDAGTGEKMASASVWTEAGPDAGMPQTRGPQSQVGAYANSVPQGLTGMVGGAIAGTGRQTMAYAAQGTQRQLAVMDAIDQGKEVPQELDVIGYQFFSPEQRAKARAEFTAAEPDLAKREPNAAVRIGEAVQDAGKRAFPVAPENEGIGTGVGRLIGGALPIAAATAIGGPVGLTASMALIGSQTYDSTYKEAIASGSTPDQAEDAAGKSALAQAVVMVGPVGRLMQRVPMPLRDGLAATLINLGKHGVDMSAGNALGTFANNYVASQTYDPERHLTQGVMDAGLEGAIAGLIVPAVGGLARAARAPKATPADVMKAPTLDAAIDAANEAARAPEGATAPGGVKFGDLFAPKADEAAQPAAEQPPATFDGPGPYRVSRTARQSDAGDGALPDHGLYMNLEGETHYGGPDAERQSFVAEPSNVLRVEPPDRKSPYHGSAGTEAARALLGGAEANRLLSLSFKEAEAEASARGIALPEGMNPVQRLTEILGAQAAREAGHDAIIMNGRTTHGDPPEMVVLDKSILKPTATAETQSVGAAASRQGTPPEEIGMSAADFAANRLQGEVERLAAPPRRNDRTMYIPDTKPTLAETTGDPLEAGKQKLNRQQPEAIQEHIEQETRNADALANYYADTASSRQLVERMERERAARAERNVRSVFGDPKSERPPADPTPTLDLMQDIFNDPRQAERDSVVKILNGLVDKFHTGNGEMKTDPYALYGIGEHINDILRGVGDTETNSAARVLKRELTQIKESLYSDIEKAAPGFARYREEYTRDSREITALKLLQEERLSLLNKDRHITPAAFFKFMKDIVEGRADPMDPASSLSEEQMDRLWNITDHLKRQTLIDAGNPRGSATSMLTEWGKRFGVAAAHVAVLPYAPVVGNIALKMGGDMLHSRFVRKETNRLLNPDLTQPDH